MPKHTRRMPLISARHLPEGKPDWRRFDLASAEISFTTSLRLAKQRVHCRGHRSCGHARVFRRNGGKLALENATKEIRRCGALPLRR